MGASWGFGGASWGILGLLRWLLAHLMPSEAVLRASRGRLGALLERFRAVVGPSREHLRPSWGPLGPTWVPLGGLLGCLGAILEASWAVSGGRKPKRARTSKSVQNVLKINVCCPLGLSWRASWSSLGSLLGSFGASWCLLGRLRALGPSDAFGGRLGRLSRPS